MICACISLAAASPVESYAQAKPLPGTVGKIGIPAKVGKYQFILTEASFATRVAHSVGTAVAPKEKKYLLLNYTIQNPGKTDLGFDWASIRFTVVSEDNANHKNAEIVLNPEKMTSLNLELKPLQKVPALAFIEVPATDPIPKLIVQGPTGPVLRFDLKGKVKKFTGLFAAPDSVTVLDEDKAAVGAKVGLGRFDFVVEKVDETTDALGELMPPEDGKLIAITVAYTNPTKLDVDLDWGSYELKLTDSNDEPIEYRNILLRAVGNTNLSDTVKPGASVRGRLIFSGPKAAKVSSLSLGLPEGRTVTVSLK